MEVVLSKLSGLSLLFVELSNYWRKVVSVRNHFVPRFGETNRPDVKKSSIFFSASSLSFSSKSLFVAFLPSRDLTGLAIALRVLLTRTDFDFLRPLGCGVADGIAGGSRTDLGLMSISFWGVWMFEFLLGFLLKQGVVRSGGLRGKSLSLYTFQWRRSAWL